MIGRKSGLPRHRAIELHSEVDVVAWAGLMVIAVVVLLRPGARLIRNC